MLEDVILHIVEEYFYFRKNGFWRQLLGSWRNGWKSIIRRTWVVFSISSVEETARRILLSNVSMSSVTFCQLTSLGSGKNAGPFLRREHSTSVSSEEVRLIGFKSGKLTLVVTSWYLTSFLVGILVFLWAVLLKHRVLLLLLLGCMVWSNCSGWRSVASENLWRALFFRAISSATICTLTSLQMVSAIFSHCHERGDRAGNVISYEGLWS